ncbi:diguanylate cyclase [Pseudomonas sp. NPDC090208]|uniref:sensor domain-containing diguanylate cyclase n=1 Tax=Pseudomonas sp. NPDC090208 TaxID=3364478 RepID=UPI00381F1F2E
MRKLSAPALNLGNLILTLTLSAVLVTLGNSLLVAFNVYRDILIHNTLSSNALYATKVARDIRDTLDADLSKIRYSSTVLARQPDRTTEELQRLLFQDSSFTSLVIANAAGEVTATLPDKPELKGKVLHSWEPAMLTGTRVSSAFMSLSGNLVIFISSPIFNAEEKSIGVIGGTLHLRADNSLADIVGNHSFRNGTQISLVDGAGTYIAHSDPAMLGLKLQDNALLVAMSDANGGSLLSRNDNGSEALVGFTLVPGTHWWAITRQPLEMADTMVYELIRAMAWHTLPLGAVGLVLIFWGVARISRPLRQLATGAKQLSEHSVSSTVNNVDAWYVEAWRIKRALLVGISLVQEKLGALDEQAHRDALTGLANRRAMDQTLEDLVAQETPFSVIAADIDHFKKVNDTLGHEAGDKVLAQVANLLLMHSRNTDLACRSGGEEFLILLPRTTLDAAAGIAERIRLAVQNEAFQNTGQITISIGVAHWQPRGETTPSQLLKRADALLYAAKQDGRNRVVVDMANTAVA